MHFLGRLFEVVPVRRIRLIAPLAALVAFALSAIVFAAQTGLAFCGNRVALPAAPMGPMDDMGDMPMAAISAGHHVIMICPVVLVLIIASMLIAAAAIVVVIGDSDRATTLNGVARSLARLPVVPVASCLVACAVSAVALMISVDGNGVPQLGVCALLAAVVLSCAFALAALAHLTGVAILAFGKRLICALLLAIAQRTAARTPSAVSRSPRQTAGETIRLFAAGCGLRAPPSFVR